MAIYKELVDRWKSSEISKREKEIGELKHRIRMLENDIEILNLIKYEEKV